MTRNPAQPRFLKRLALAALNMLVPLHIGLVVFYYAGRWLGGRDLWYIDALGYILPWLFLPSPFLLALALICRARVRLILALIPLGLFALTYGHLYLPRPLPGTTEPTFSAMTYNVLYLNPHADQVARAIKAQNPDFVGLRELVPDVAAYLEPRLSERYPFHELGEWCGFWSRYPILEYDYFRLGKGTGQPAQRFLLDVDGRQVTVLNVHPRSPPLAGIHPLGLPLGIPTGFVNAGRDADLRELLERVDRISGPLVVIGDLNMTDQQGLYPTLTRRLRDAYRDVGWGMGFTFTRFRGLGLPMWRIDYVLHSPDLVALRAVVGDYGGSDHRPVMAELAFAEAP